MLLRFFKLQKMGVCGVNYIGTLTASDDVKGGERISRGLSDMPESDLPSSKMPNSGCRILEIVLSACE